jgi:hypothetical protein
VHVADDVERAVVGAAVGPQWLALDCGRFDLVDTVEDPCLVEPLAAQAAERAVELAELVAQDVRSAGDHGGGSGGR